MQATDEISVDSITKDSYRLLSDEQRYQLENSANKLQRKHRLLAVVAKRQANIQYLYRVHLGDFYWLNCVLISKQSLRQHVSQPVYKQRTLSYAYLGMGIARLLTLPNGFSFVNAVTQLFEEWEYHFSSIQSVKYVLAKNSTSAYSQPNTITNLSTDETINASKTIKTNLYKFNNSIVYEILQCPHIPFSLDYIQVLLSLCETLLQLYTKLPHPDCYTNSSVYDAIVKLDAKIKHHFINLVSKELTEACIQIMKKDLIDVRGINNPQSITTNSELQNELPIEN